MKKAFQKKHKKERKGERRKEKNARDWEKTVPPSSQSQARLHLDYAAEEIKEKVRGRVEEREREREVNLSEN